MTAPAVCCSRTSVQGPGVPVHGGARRSDAAAGTCSSPRDPRRHRHPHGACVGCSNPLGARCAAVPRDLDDSETVRDPASKRPPSTRVAWIAPPPGRRRLRQCRPSVSLNDPTRSGPPVGVSSGEPTGHAWRRRPQGAQLMSPSTPPSSNVRAPAPSMSRGSRRPNVELSCIGPHREPPRGPWAVDDLTGTGKAGLGYLHPAGRASCGYNTAPSNVPGDTGR